MRNTSLRFLVNRSPFSWQYFSEGLPNTIVNDMEIYYAGGKLRAATYGRGIWISDMGTIQLASDDVRLENISNPINNKIRNTP